MSSNPFRDLPESNPYASPAPGYSPPATGNPLLAPAVFLLILSSIYILMILASLPRQILRLRAIDLSAPDGVAELTGMLVPLTLMPLMNVAIALGAIAMIRLKNYRTAYVGAILSLIPFCSPCFILGIPFGIWALILLNRTDVKERFPA